MLLKTEGTVFPKGPMLDKLSQSNGEISKGKCSCLRCTKSFTYFRCQIGLLSFINSQSQTVLSTVLVFAFFSSSLSSSTAASSSVFFSSAFFSSATAKYKIIYIYLEIMKIFSLPSSSGTSSLTIFDFHK